jgi:diguanylate cyclase (GGDEF)-like protein
MHPLKQCVNTFKNKVSLSIHPTDAAPRRSMGFLDRFDKFKEINDQHSHKVSDSIRCVTAKPVVKNIRDVDLFSCWGGDKFVIIFLKLSKK